MDIRDIDLVIVYGVPDSMNEVYVMNIVLSFINPLRMRSRVTVVGLCVCVCVCVCLSVCLLPL